MINEKKLIEALKLSNSHHASNSREKSLLDRVIRIVKEQPKIENTEDFKHFKLYADSILKSMSKKELIDYIHIVYENWKSTDWYYNNHINYAKKLEKDRQWIPCSERLPEINTSVLVTWRKYITNQKFVDKLFLNDNSEWVCDLGKINGKAVAWMPLPEPYKGDE